MTPLSKLTRSVAPAAPLAALLLVATLVATALACTSDPAPAAANDRERPPTRVFVTEVSTHTTSSDVVTVGSLRSPRTTVVSPDVAGIVQALDAPEGREIGRGHVIARLDDAEDRAAVKVAEARHRNAELAVQRARPLVDGGVVAQQVLDDAEAELATAEGLLEEARTRLGKTVVRAPFAGLVGIQTAQLGQYVGSGDPLIELTQLDPLELLFTVPEEQASQVRIGQVIDGRVGRCGMPFEAVVEARNPALDASTRTLTVQAAVPNPERELLPGMSVRVRLRVGEQSEALVIPREALVAQGTGYVAWVVADDDTAAPQPVTPVRFLPDVVEVEGIAAGTRVVAAGHQKLQPGAPVAPEPWQATMNPNLARGASEEDDCFGEQSTVREPEAAS